MRILHCIRTPVGGVFRHVRDLIELQSAAGHSVGLLCDSTTGGETAAAQIEMIRPKLALGVLRVPMRRAASASDLLAGVEVIRHMARLAPQVVHGHGAKGGSYARIAGTAVGLAGGRPVRLYSPHGGSLHYDKASLAGRFYFGVERMLESFTDALVFVSGFEQQTYAAKVGRPRTASALVYNGLSQGEYEPVPLRPDAADFVVVGEMRYLKGTDVFIRAVAELDRRGRRVTALLVGPGTERPAYEQLAAELGVADRIAFSGPLPVREALARGRVSVVPSRAESLPYVVLETIAAARPLIATRVGGIPEIFGARADRLVEPGDVTALADALGARLSDLDTAVAEAEALRHAIRPVFSIEAMAAGVEGLYRQLIGARAGTGSAPAGSVRPGTALNDGLEAERLTRVES